MYRTLFLVIWSPFLGFNPVEGHTGGQSSSSDRFEEIERFKKKTKRLRHETWMTNYTLFASASICEGGSGAAMFPFHFNPSRWLAADDPGWASSRWSSGADSRTSVSLHLLGCCEASLPLGGSRSDRETLTRSR